MLDRPEFARLGRRLAAGAAAPTITGVTEAAKPYLVAGLVAEGQRPLLYVVRDNEAAEPVAEALRALLGRGIPVHIYPDRDALPHERLMPDAESVQGRMNVLTALLRPVGPVVVVCSARALTQPVMAPEELAALVYELRPGGALDPMRLLERLAALGYETVAEVEAPGQISHRGGIVDLFPPALVRPVRVEFWGDEV
ncbi:MAG TPA: hypothetical protein VF832_20040, partial [Longimicrobiales bacterium]